jgi:hypothetical protein
MERISVYFEGTAKHVKQRHPWGRPKVSLISEVSSFQGASSSEKDSLEPIKMFYFIGCLYCARLHLTGFKEINII